MANYESKKWTLSFSFPFNIPSSPESAAIRIVRNLGKFSLYYAIFVWTVLFITLIPERKDSVVCLVITTEITFLYFLLLRSFPDSILLHKIIDKRVVLFLVFVITAVLLILTRAAVHLLVVLAATLPVVLLHAVVSRTEDVVVHEEAGEMASLVQQRLGDADQSLV
ncbi:PRA1 family protein F4 [Sesamum alatum]|uniref:PRA1 family protein n=1 Tax=Sesamum alatum TaxID=300844 RepID=A0AAE1XMW8_9LAMI|nr:PRA1 family protein F4 [Sesamum alatum]